MRILHTADLHLDSTFCAQGANDSARCRDEQREVLKRIFALAKELSCDMILIAGDLFDSVFVSPESAKLCASLFADFAKPVIISPGNHDPYVDGSFYKTYTLSDNVYVFSSTELQYFDFSELGVTVAGFAFCGSALASSPLSVPAIDVSRRERTLLLCAHGDVNVPMSRYAPMLLSDISRHGFSYAALGHVHNPPFISETVRYSGFAQGRAFDEIGEGSVLVIDIDENGEVTVTEKVVSTQKYVVTEIYLNADMTDEQIYEKIRKTVTDSACDGYSVHLRIELCGQISCELLLADGEYSTDGVEVQIKNKVLCLPDIDKLQRDKTLRGEFYRALAQKLYSDDSHERELAAEALRIGIAAIDGRDFTSGGKR